MSATRTQCGAQKSLLPKTSTTRRRPRAVNLLPALRRAARRRGKPGRQTSMGARIDFGIGFVGCSLAHARPATAFACALDVGDVRGAETAGGGQEAEPGAFPTATPFAARS